MARRYEKHGASKTPEHDIWMGMIARCESPTHHKFASYGGRGIKVCETWSRSFSAFLADVGPRPSPTHTLDRENNDGDYEPGNVRWATRSQQQSNRRVNHLLTHNGQTHTVTEWSKITGLHYVTIILRIKRGWSIDEALTRPAQKKRRVG